MYNKDGTAKYKDMKDTVLPDFLNLSKGQETKGASFLIPPKFLNNPVVKYINDQISINKQKTDTMVEQILYDPMFASDKLLAPGREKGKSFSDYIKGFEMAYSRGTIVKCSSKEQQWWVFTGARKLVTHSW